MQALWAALRAEPEIVWSPRRAWRKARALRRIDAIVRDICGVRDRIERELEAIVVDSTRLQVGSCEQCGERPRAYHGARFCGAACSARHEARRRRA